MNIKYLEAQLEKLVEGAFAQIFSRRVTAHDIAIRLVRSMESQVRRDEHDMSLFVPDQYRIRLHPDVEHRLQNGEPSLGEILTTQIIEIARQSGYRLAQTPIIQIIADDQLQPHDVRIRSSYMESEQSGTQAMQPIPQPANLAQPKQAQLIINGKQQFKLDKTLVNIGRESNNHLVLDDPFISRHHIQIRLRFGDYMLFDVDSRGGTHVNGVHVTEHRLQTGDVIVIGRTQLIYVSDDGHTPYHTTQAFPRVDS